MNDMIFPTYVANNFLHRAFTQNVPVTPMKLQRLIYFLYKEYYKRTGEILFSEQFQTWRTGPVLSSLYAKFGCSGTERIRNYAKDSKGKVRRVTETRTFKESIDKVWALYGNYSEISLSQLFMSANTAWSKAVLNKQLYLDLENIKDEPELYAN